MNQYLRKEQTRESADLPFKTRCYRLNSHGQIRRSERINKLATESTEKELFYSRPQNYIECYIRFPIVAD